jgi:peptide/nickel transport system permease protein
LGVLAATKQYSWVDTILSVFTFLGMTIPRFLMALIILYVMAFKFNVQELGSFYSTQYGGQPMSWGKFVDLVKHIWPIILIATVGGLAYNMRVMRANLLDTLNAQYVETARKRHERKRRNSETRRAQCTTSVGGLSRRGSALHADRRN